MCTHSSTIFNLKIPWFILTNPNLVNIINLIKQDDEASKTLAKVTESWNS